MDDGTTLEENKAGWDEAKEKIEEKLSKTDDSGNTIVSFISNDNTNPTAWTDITIVKSKDQLSALMQKLSLAVKNLRYLYKLLGNTDISTIGGGTVTGALNKLNTDILNKVSTNDTRLSDSRTPKEHNHNNLYYTEAEINTLLSQKQKSLTIDAAGQILTVQANSDRVYDMASLFGNRLSGKTVLVANAKLVSNALGVSIGMDSNSNTKIILWNNTSKTKDVGVVLVLLVC